MAVYYQYRISDLIEHTKRRPISSSSATVGGPPAGFEFEARTELGKGYSIEAATQVARGGRWMTSALDDVSPAASPSSAARIFRIADTHRPASRGTRKTIDRDRVRSPRRCNLLDVGAGWLVLPRVELRRQLRNRSTMTITRVPIRDGYSRRAGRSVFLPSSGLIRWPRGIRAACPATPISESGSLR